MVVAGWQGRHFEDFRHGQEVLSFVRTFGVHKRGANPFKDVFPEPEAPIRAEP